MKRYDINDWASANWPKLGTGNVTGLLAHAQLKRRYRLENARLRIWTDEEKAARDTGNPLERRLKASGLSGVGLPTAEVEDDHG